MASKFVVGVDGESRYTVTGDRAIAISGIAGNMLSLPSLLYVYNKTQDVTYYMPVEGMTTCTVSGNTININPVFTKILSTDELIIFLHYTEAGSSILGSVDIATADVSETLQREGVGIATSVELQLDWDNVSVPYDVEVIVKSRSERTMKYSPMHRNMRGVLESASGSFVFNIWRWSSEDIQIEVLKHNCTTGNLTVAINIKN